MPEEIKGEDQKGKQVTPEMTLISNESFPSLRVSCLDLAVRNYKGNGPLKTIAVAKKLFDFALSDGLEYRVYRRIACLESVFQMGVASEVDDVLLAATALAKWAESGE